MCFKLNVNGAIFQEHIHSVFSLKTTAGNWPVELIKVSRKDEPSIGPDSKEYECFSVEFLDSDKTHPILEQSMYEFEHPEMGTFAIFIVPVQQDNKGIYYHAGFNILMDDDAVDTGE